jgi:hypothetical protein
MPDPGPIPQDVLTRTDLCAALKEHDFAAVFALIKKYGGLSQNRIAAACALRALLETECGGWVCAGQA